MEEKYNGKEAIIRLDRKDIAKILNGKLIKCFHVEISIGMVEE